jgi:hypothetical protein
MIKIKGEHYISDIIKEKRFNHHGLNVIEQDKLQKKIENLIVLKRKKIFIGEDKLEINNICDFIYYFYNKALKTCYYPNMRVQASSDRRRSLDDGYLCLLHYFPNVKYLEFEKIMYNISATAMWNNGEHCLINTFCSDIKKSVFWAYNILSKQEFTRRFENINNK